MECVYKHKNVYIFVYYVYTCKEMCTRHYVYTNILRMYTCVFINGWYVYMCIICALGIASQAHFSISTWATVRFYKCVSHIIFSQSRTCPLKNLRVLLQWVSYGEPIHVPSLRDPCSEGSFAYSCVGFVSPPCSQSFSCFFSSLRLGLRALQFPGVHGGLETFASSWWHRGLLYHSSRCGVCGICMCTYMEV
jgi:hypothetical protein